MASIELMSHHCRLGLVIFGRQCDLPHAITASHEGRRRGSRLEGPRPSCVATCENNVTELEDVDVTRIYGAIGYYSLCTCAEVGLAHTWKADLNLAEGK
jgi:hypothetical protein